VASLQQTITRHHMPMRQWSWALLLGCNPLWLPAACPHRIGREKCLMVNWPVSRETSFAPGVAATADAGSYARKDACEVLEKDGPAVLKQYIDAAKPLPIRGLYPFDKFWTQV